MTSPLSACCRSPVRVAGFKEDGAVRYYWCEECGRACDIVGDADAQIIEAALRASDWNVKRAAERLGETRDTLRYRMRKYGIRRIKEAANHA